MTRADFTAALQVRPQYLSMVYHKIPGEAAWTLIQQGRTLSPDLTADKTDVARIGDKNKTTVYGSITTDITMRLYFDNDVEEVARVLGVIKPATWVGSETIQLDPTLVSDFKIVNFDSATIGAAEKFTEYINHFAPGKLSPALDADENGGRVVDLSGAAAAYYIIPAAGT